ncbi:MAG: hypothetical protein HY882_12155 [Deltaproteobacteria bacterium]|nr:hypothetical protein [Deltaproteobacteria bacterium]
METIPSRIKRLFWDVEKDGVEIKAHRFYIIKPIMDNGHKDYVRCMMAIYTSEEILEVVKRGRGLSRKSAYFWAAYFQIPLEEVECLHADFFRRL